VARRQETSVVEDIFRDVFKLTPTWVGPVVAAVVYLLLRFGVPLVSPPKPKAFDGSAVLRLFLPTLAWLIPALILLVWIAAEVHKLRNRRLLDGQSGIDSIRALSWPAFEQLVCEAYRRKGYLAEAIGCASGDGGVDVQLTGHEGTVVVQCKQWRVWRVGVPTVRELLGVVVSRKAAKGILVTSGRFTAEARRFASQNPQIELVDGPRLAELVAAVRTERPAATADAQPATSAGIPGNTQPACPACGAAMILRTARRGTNAGSRFWGCSNYPDCRATRRA